MTPENKFGLNSCYQQKRSGDWLQVLLCMLIRKRQYVNFKTNAEITNISEIYLVTHDRIALCFALLMGVNVIFTHGHRGNVYAFRLNDPVEIEAILDAQISKIKFEALIKALITMSGSAPLSKRKEASVFKA